ncbi:MAG: hypothetical protein HOQ26_05205 [Gemmatimonadaceae bacterium]|nr:hypothetical protein [Gemmatimonadaceae bacterium]
MKDNELRFRDDAPDREIGEALRALVAAPSGAYWGELESRIMARVAEEQTSPWSVLAGWTRPAAIAAALLLVAATLLLTRLNERESAIAYGAVAEEQYPASDAISAPANENATTLHLLLER